VKMFGHTFHRHSKHFGQFFKCLSWIRFDDGLQDIVVQHLRVTTSGSVFEAEVAGPEPLEPIPDLSFTNGFGIYGTDGSGGRGTGTTLPELEESYVPNVSLFGLLVIHLLSLN